MSGGASFIYALLAGILPSLLWLWFWTREDADHGEPKKLLALSFAAGMIAVIAALFVEQWIAGYVPESPLRYILWAVAEELLKYIALLSILASRRTNDEPIRAMIYAVVIALGFAALENTLFILDPFSRGLVAQGLITGNYRFFGATLVHIVSTAVAGFALGFTYYRGHIATVASAFLGLAGAIALHATFNLSIINADPSSTLATFGWVWGAVVILILLFEEVKGVRPRMT